MIDLSEKLSGVIDGFDLVSYYAGINMAFAEVVDAGCKRLALSSPYDKATAELMREPTRLAAQEYGVKILEEEDLLVTRLFPRDIATGKTVFLIAQDEGVLTEYGGLKEMKRRSDAQANPDEVENEIAWRLGHLLSYSDKKIEELIKKNG
ncbi:hypothetical protein JXL21_15085 [Candidatus Bathyarchaeota archaeon]|nr:hypothetical protein [Candidatus Bathyarchaeota archaeon]